MQKVLIFVDQANFFHAAVSRERYADLIKLRDYLADPGKGRLLLEMVVYLGFPPQRKPMPPNWRKISDQLHKMKDSLEYNGLITVVHYGKQIYGTASNGDPMFSANVDVLMAMDAVEFAFNADPDIVVLVTGDGDFAYLAQKLRRRGIRVEAASTENQMASALKRAVNSFIDLDDFFATLEGRPIGGDSNFFDQR